MWYTFCVVVLCCTDGRVRAPDNHDAIKREQLRGGGEITHNLCGNGHGSTYAGGVLCLEIPESMIALAESKMINTTDFSTFSTVDCLRYYR